jgi:hypothetical protein
MSDKPQIDLSTEVLSLVKAFENKTLAKSSWTHQAHLSVGIYYLLHFSFYEALCLLKANIITYNQSVGTVNNSTSGYHETLTIFWLKVLANFIESVDDKNLSLVCRKFFASKWASKEIPFLYYSRERLFSAEARAIWVNPDLATLNQPEAFHSVASNLL